MTRPSYCDGFRKLLNGNRRQLLHAGSLAALGLTTADLAKIASATPNSTSPVRAKSCIFIFMWGGPSQLDTFDLKPEAPAEIRGEFNPIATAVPGIQICEHFTKLAKLTDRLSIVRSLTHNDPAHLSSGHATLTGQLAPVTISDATPPSPKDSPHLGSLLTKLRPNQNGMPSFVAMPWRALHPAAPGGEAPGQHGGWLGQSCDGMLLKGDPNHPEWKPSGLSLPADISLERLESRTQLLRILDQQQSRSEQLTAPNPMGDFQNQAMQMLCSPTVKQAFDLNQESAATRDRYGRNIHGQCVLLARRLIEHGVSLVSVNWHNDGQNFWDTHGNNFNRLKNDLIPPADIALSALIEDLEQRGLLDETLVVWVGEFGRKPQITPQNAGREHWPWCYSGLLAGGGIRKGTVYGSSDRHGAYPSRDPVSPQDFATTILHQMGIASDTTLLDRENRPHRVTAGKVIDELIA